MSIESLPEDVLLRIANHLPKRDATCLSMCSKQMYGSLQKWLAFVGSEGDEDVEMSLKLVGRSVLSFGACGVSADGGVTGVIVQQMVGMTLYRIETENKVHSSFDLDWEMQLGTCLDVSYSGRTIVVTGGQRGVINVFLDESMQDFRSVEVGASISFVRISPDEQHIVAAVEGRPELMLLSREGKILQQIQLGRQDAVPVWYELDFTVNGDIIVTLSTTTSEHTTKICLGLKGGTIAKKSATRFSSPPPLRPQYFDILSVAEESRKSEEWRNVDIRDAKIDVGKRDGLAFHCTEDGNLWSACNPSTLEEVKSDWVGFGTFARRGPWVVKYTLTSSALQRSSTGWCRLKVSVSKLGDYDEEFPNGDVKKNFADDLNDSY